MNVLSFPSSESASAYDVVCFSHLRWDFVYQRPQHLLSRFARNHDVWFIEEPIYGEGEPRLQVTQKADRLWSVVPHIALETSETEQVVRNLITEFLTEHRVEKFVSWYYTPMMLDLSEHLEPTAVVYDCMDELSAFKNAPAELQLREAELFDLADLVFTGGRTLYESKRERHEAVYCFPSSIDVAHFEKALAVTRDPDDQAGIARPRVGFFGVIDERTDLQLLAAAADLRPEWQFVMIGPVVKIDENDLPRRANIHYLGGKSYDELPHYIAGWDVAMMPFAINESTKFISPTKTPEYLAAGRPVVSTPIRDVVRPYGEAGLVRIASTAEEFATAIDEAINEDADERRRKAGEFLDTMSWDKTYAAMSELIAEAVAANTTRRMKVGV
ncbi:MAG TPA: glycosyltransferase family 1 protein [Pyrinomonadaceae bacterium]|nr:glycosyltransferase family 1 protein [Pyrinomonadaceae bacterium]